jgi:hypothetical protein
MTDSDRLVYVLTVRQPNAWAIFHAGKDKENRARRPPANCRLLIHAGKTYDRSSAEQMQARGIVLPEVLPVGCILGSVDIDDEAGLHHPGSWWSVRGLYNWPLISPRLASGHLDVRGRQWLFLPPEGWQNAVFPKPGAAR